MNIKRHIPNTITCGNLLCGCLAIVCAFNGNLVWSAYLVGIAAVLDFFDGFAARLLKVSGEMGKQLDSLADMVTFGVVPGVVMYQLINISLAMGALQDTHMGVLIRSLHLSYIAFLIPIFSAIRLAKFNIDTRQTNLFIGVPTPANTILICSIPLILYFNFQFPAVTGEFYLSLIKKSQTSAELGLYNDTTDYIHLILNPYFLIGLTLVMSYMLVAELPLFALKFKNFGWADNKIRYSFLIISVVLLILFQFIAIPFIIFLYIILSVINNSFNKQKQHNKY